jgi:hypothetical protein
MASEECGSGRVDGAVSLASRASNPSEVAPGICNEEEGLRWGAKADGDKVLARTGGSSGHQGGFGGGSTVVLVAVVAVMEKRETLEV